MKPRTLLVLVVLVLVQHGGGGDLFSGTHLDELLSLSELPFKKLLHVKRSFLDDSDQDLFSRNGSEDLPPTEGLHLGEGAEAQALVGGHSKRVNPLLPRLKSTRRFSKGGGGGGPWWKSKSKKGSISSIFQMSITTLSFLAFGGYLVCMIVTAVRNSGGMMAMAGMTAPAPQNSPIVFLGNRPAYGRRRKRQDTINLPEAEDEDGISVEDETSTRETTAQIPAFTEQSETDPVTEAMPHHDEDTEFGHIPAATFDDMYRALLMISEGYSLYHQNYHTS